MMRIRPFRKSDAADLVGLVRALAGYEKLEPPTAAASRRLVADVGRRIRVLIAEESGRAVGYAIYLFTYSSFLARPTLYLEDVFVLPDARGRGAGQAFFKALRREAVREGCGRLEWMVLRWNKPAIRFYDRLGGKPLTGWLSYRLTLRRS